MYSLETYSPQLRRTLWRCSTTVQKSFLLSHRTTLAELAEFVDELGSRHDGVPLAVQVQFEHRATNDRQSAIAPSCMMRLLRARSS